VKIRSQWPLIAIAASAVSVLGFGVAVAEPAKQQVVTKTAQPAGLSVPPTGIQVLLVRTVLVALDQANKTGNYAGLRALGAPNIQQQTAEQLDTAFAPLRAQSLDLAPVLLVAPQFNPSFVTPEGVLQLSGIFHTQPVSVKFSVAMSAVGGYWRLAAVSVNGAKLPRNPLVRKAPPKPPAVASAPSAAPVATESVTPPPPNPVATPAATATWRTN
jgi:hypothetical protein